MAGLLLAGLAVATIMAAALPATARGGDQPTTAGAPGRGQLLSAQLLRTLSTKDEVVAELRAGQFDPKSSRYGVDAYQLVYRTVDASGQPTIASGLLALPRNGERGLRTVSFTHGTEVNRTDAPSLWKDTWAVGPVITYASAGFAAVAPDYLGMGLGPGAHPFLDVPSETTAALDMLRAARSFAPTTGRILQPQVFVTGFSQGSTAAMGVARALQSGADPWFRLAALAPIGGVYDWQHVELPGLISGEVVPPANVWYMAYFVVAWNRLHHLYADPGEMFAKPYAGVVERLFDGVHTGQDLMQALPGEVKRVFTPQGLAMLSHPSGELEAAMRVYDSTCSDWTPRAPIRLYVSGGDEQALPANTQHCHAALRSHGVDVTIVDVGDLIYNDSKHLGANILGTAANVEWFKRLP